MHEGLAIPLASKHPDRALMFIEKLILDKDINRLTSYGIEGEHYEVDPEGWYVALQDTATSGFAWEASNSWAWRNTDFMLLPKEKEYQVQRYAEIEPKAGLNYIEGFAEDYTSYQTERAALGTVMTQYLQPLHAGLVDDVEASIAEFLKQAESAGLDKIQEEYSKQWKEYIASIPE
jgi:putative aldouronate transport system substrate-binding protein